MNCEYVPALPAGVVRQLLNDPRRIPYLLIWRSPRDGGVKEVVRVTSLGPPPYLPDTESIEVKRPEGSASYVRVIKRSLPRNGGYAILFSCPICWSPRRALYGWEPGGQYTSSAQRSPWQCRRCAGLRYASEGGALVLRSRGSWFRRLEMEYGTTRSDRPEPWYPYVFSNPADASTAGVANSAEGWTHHRPVSQ